MDNNETLNNTETVENTEIVDNTEITEETDISEETRKKSYPTQTVLTIRAIVGGYVFYLAYQIVTSGDEVTGPMWAAIGLFFVAGAALVIMSVKHFICGEYEGGKKDV